MLAGPMTHWIWHKRRVTPRNPRYLDADERAKFTIIAAMAELEGSIIRERVEDGSDLCQANRPKSSKPIGRRRRVFDREAVLLLG